MGRGNRSYQKSRGRQRQIRDTMHQPGGGRFMENGATTAVRAIELMMLRRLQEMCVNRFIWEGLPDSINPRFIEKVLFENALAVYCRPKNMVGLAVDAGNPNLADVVLRGTPSGMLDYQDDPLAFTVTANGAFQGEEISVKECVPIWANTARMPDIDIVRWYARRLAEAERTIDINLKNARHTRLITIEDTQRMTAYNMQQKMDEGEAVIVVNSAMDSDAYKVMNFDLPKDVLKDVPIAKNQIMNDCLTMLGVNNVNSEKKERLVGGEIDARSEQVGVNRAIALSERQRAAEKINKMFKLNVAVTWNEEITADVEGEENGELHNTGSGRNEDVS